MKEEGFVVFYRKITKWEWYKNSSMVHLFMHLIIHANHADKKWEGLTIKRGQVVTGRKALNIATGISVQTLRTNIMRLKDTGEITVKSTNKYSIITIVNYDDYQEIKKPANQQLTNNQPTTNQQLTTNNNVNNDNNKDITTGGKNPPPPPAPKKKTTPAKKFIKPTVDEVAEYCATRKNGIDPEYFIDKYDGNGWMVGKNKMKCWKSVIRTWEKNNYSTGRACAVNGNLSAPKTFKGNLARKLLEDMENGIK